MELAFYPRYRGSSIVLRWTNKLHPSFRSRTIFRFSETGTGVKQAPGINIQPLISNFCLPIVLQDGLILQ